MRRPIFFVGSTCILHYYQFASLNTLHSKTRTKNWGDCMAFMRAKRFYVHNKRCCSEFETSTSENERENVVHLSMLSRGTFDMYASQKKKNANDAIHPFAHLLKLDIYTAHLFISSTRRSTALVEPAPAGDEPVFWIRLASPPRWVFHSRFRSELEASVDMFELDEIERSLNRLIALSVLSLRLDLTVIRPDSCGDTLDPDEDDPSRVDCDIFLANDDDDDTIAFCPVWLLKSGVSKRCSSGDKVVEPSQSRPSKILLTLLSPSLADLCSSCCC